MREALSKTSFLLVASSFCLAYFIFQYFFNRYTMLSVDEFWFAHRTYEYQFGLPYRDFAPYKTVLGYYILLLPMLFSQSIIDTLITMKQSLALLNTLIFFSGACFLTRFFSKKAILVSLFLLLTSEIVLSYSSQIRVDLLAYWFGFFSLLSLLNKRFILAGLLLGLGLATSQKMMWYLFASNIALTTCWLLIDRDKKTFFNIIKFNATIIMIICCYLLLWSLLSDSKTVFNSVFNEAIIMYQLDWYDHARKAFWSAILFYNPILFLLSPLALLSLFFTDHDDDYAKRLLVTIFSMVILGCLIPYQQVFPYYMQVTFPVFFVLYSAFFTWFFKISTSQSIHQISALSFLNKKLIAWSFSFCYTIFIISLIYYLLLPSFYLLIAIIPILFSLSFYHSLIARDAYFKVSCGIIFLIGVVFSLILLGVKYTHMSGRYQKIHIESMQSLLKNGGTYLAGIELIYNQTQPISGMRHLMGPAVHFLYTPSEKLRRVMLASLYADPNASIHSVITTLSQSPVKFYVNNYRIMALPPQIKNFLASHYIHLFGSIYIYAPQFPAGKHQNFLAYTGNYSLHTDKKETIILNGYRHEANQVIYLQKGKLISNAKKPYRLILLPDSSAIHQELKKDEWEKIIF